MSQEIRLLRAAVLERVLALVPFDGWSEYTLAQAAGQCKQEGAGLARAFPKGMSDCLAYFFSSSDDALQGAFSAGTLSAKRVPERIEALLLARLDYWRPHKEAVRRALAVRSLPWNAAKGVASVASTADLMWRLAGDGSTDFSYYTKRATLAGIYSSTVLYWLNDTSPDEVDTRQFISRRLQGVAAFGKWKKQMQDKVRSWAII